MRQKLLVFHPVIAPYRIDFFNALCETFHAEVYLYQKNLVTQTFDMNALYKQLCFKPRYLLQKWNLGLFSVPKGIFSALRENKPDIVMVTEYNMITLIVLLYKYLFFRRFKVVSIVDDSYDMVTNDNDFSKWHKYARMLVARLLDNLINVEPRVAEWYQAHYQKGIYFPIICEDRKARDRLKRILPISENLVTSYQLEGKRVLLFVGRLVELKNLFFVLDAFKALAQKECVFVIVGDGPQRKDLEEYTQAIPNVIFTGRLEGEELYAWYNIAQVFTLPSTREPFGAVTNEALLGGCYVLVSCLAGSNCLIREGVNGNLINPYNQTDYVKKLELAFSKSAPCKIPLKLRKNAMPESFQSYFCRLTNELQSGVSTTN